jgi:Protein of unknown function, DUF488
MIQTPPLFTSRWANKDLVELECVPVGISRGTPRFPVPYRYRVARWLAPDDETWTTPDWTAFVASYRRQLDGLGVEAIAGGLARISEEAGGKPLCLLCFERDPGNCHRGLLVAWLREHGVEIRELEAGDLPQRQDVPQPALFEQLPREERT